MHGPRRGWTSPLPIYIKQTCEASAPQGLGRVRRVGFYCLLSSTAPGSCSPPAASAPFSAKMRNLLLALLLACGELGGEVGISSSWRKYHPNPQVLGTQVLAERCSFSAMPGVGLLTLIFILRGAGARCHLPNPRLMLAMWR